MVTNVGRADGKLMQIMIREKERQGLTWTQVAKKSGVAFATIWGWMHGRHSMRLDSVVKVLDALGLKLTVKRKGTGIRD